MTVKRNITMKNILEQRRIKVQKNKDKNCQLFMLNIYKLQILITKTLILSDHENVF